MQNMIFGDKPIFVVILERIRKMENDINQFLK